MFDDELRGFGVRIYPSGRIAFVISYRNDRNTKRFYTIGDFPNISLQQAREIAKERFHEISKGIDPQLEKETRRKEITFEEYSRFYEEIFKDKKKSWEHDAKRLARIVNPVIGKRKLSEITPQHIRTLHIKVKDDISKITANRVLSLVKHIFNCAIKDKLITESPAKYVQKYDEPPPRDIFIGPAEYRKILEACESEANTAAVTLIKLCMFTGRRVGEILNAKWEDLDLKRGILTLPDTKAGERQFVYLNEEAINVLENTPKIAGNPYIIAGDAWGKPLQTYAKAWKRVLKTAGVDYFPIHGLRHSFASTLVASGTPLETVGRLLGHKNASTTRRYSHFRQQHLVHEANRFSEVINFKEAKKKLGN